MALPPPLSDTGGRTLRELLRAGTATRPELSVALGVTKQTVSAAIAELEQRDLAEAVAVQQGPVGRSALRYGLHSRAGWVAGIDLGSPRLRIAAARLDGTLIAERSLGDPAPTVLRDWTDRLALTAHALAGIVRDTSESEGGLLGVAIAVPRPVERVRDLVGERLDDADAHLLDALAPVAPAAIWTENDVNCGAVAQLRHDPALALQSVLFVHVGIGLGAAFVVRGRLLRGARGRAGEIKQLRSPVPGDARNAEAALGAQGLLAAAGHSVGAPLLTSIDDLVAAASLGDPAAESALAAEVEGLAALILDMAALVDPDRVVLSGVVGARPEIGDRVARRCAERGMAASVGSDPFDGLATVLGAATLAADRVLQALAPATAAVPEDARAARA